MNSVWIQYLMVDYFLLMVLLCTIQRTLKWISMCSLSILHSECIIKLPGRPVNFKITQVLPERSLINIFWSQDKINSDMFFLNNYKDQCFLKVLCSDSRLEKKVILRNKYEAVAPNFCDSHRNTSSLSGLFLYFICFLCIR